jgi:hypothetical protein
VLNEGSCPSIIKYLMLYKQLFVPMIDCASPICVCATRTHVGKTQVVEEMDLAIGRNQFLCFNKEIYEDLGNNFSLTTSEH